MMHGSSQGWLGLPSIYISDQAAKVTKPVMAYKIPCTIACIAKVKKGSKQYLK